MIIYWRSIPNHVLPVRSVDCIWRLYANWHFSKIIRQFGGYFPILTEYGLSGGQSMQNLKAINTYFMTMNFHLNLSCNCRQFWQPNRPQNFMELDVILPTTTDLTGSTWLCILLQTYIITPFPTSDKEVTLTGTKMDLRFGFELSYSKIENRVNLQNSTTFFWTLDELN